LQSTAPADIIIENPPPDEAEDSQLKGIP